MREAKIIVDMIQGELLPQAVLPRAECADPSPHRGHMLAHRQVEAATVERRIAPPPAASGRSMRLRLTPLLSILMLVPHRARGIVPYCATGWPDSSLNAP